MRFQQRKAARQGMTIIEVLIAMVILSMILTAFAGVVVSSIKQNSIAGGRTASVRLLDYFGRRVAEGDAAVLPAGSDSTATWDYGSLKSSFPELANGRQFDKPELYRAMVTAQGAPGWATANGLALVSYEVSVCWKSAGVESCTDALTVGPAAPTTTSSPPPLSGIN